MTESLSGPPLKILTIDDLDTAGPIMVPADIRQGEPIFAYLISDTSSILTKASKLPVWRISPFGVDLVVPPDAFGLDAGSKISLVLQIGPQRIPFSGIISTAVRKESGRFLLGVRREAALKREVPQGSEERRGERWLTDTLMYPTGVAFNPAQFNDLIHWRVRELSGKGMKCETSLRNKLLMKGMRLDSTFSFPAIGNCKAVFEIKQTRIVDDGTKGMLIFGAEFINITQEARTIIGEYLLQFGSSPSGPPTPKTLKDAGLFFGSIAKSIEFRYVRTDEEYKKVLALRKMTYELAGNIKASDDAACLSDSYDDKARIMIGVVRGEVVATQRLVFYNNDEKCEQEQHVVFPSNFPRKDEMVEVTKTCTHPSYRGSDLLVGLSKASLLTALQAGKRYMVGSTFEKLLPLYRKLGFRATSLRYSDSKLGEGEEITIILGDLYAAVTGAGINPIIWNALFSDALKYVDSDSIKELDSMAGIRTYIYRLLSPVASYLVKRINKPRKRRT